MGETLRGLAQCGIFRCCGVRLPPSGKSHRPGPVATCSRNRRSCCSCWGRRTRTFNLRINSPLLCQLSYTPLHGFRGAPCGAGSRFRCGRSQSSPSPAARSYTSGKSSPSGHCFVIQRTSIVAIPMMTRAQTKTATTFGCISITLLPPARWSASVRRPLRPPG